MIKKIKSLLGSIRNVATRYRNDEPIQASEQKTRTRLKVCAGCDMYASHIDTCMECFCVMRIKASLEGERCPLHHWD